MLLDISHDSPWHRDSDCNVPHSCTRLNTLDTLDADWSAPTSHTGTHCPQKGSSLPPDPQELSADRRMNSMPRFTSLSRQSLRL